jgi:hypothetical protein
MNMNDVKIHDSSETVRRWAAGHMIAFASQQLLDEAEFSRWMSLPEEKRHKFSTFDKGPVVIPDEVLIDRAVTMADLMMSKLEKGQ